MASKYLGTKNNLATVEKIFELTNFRDGSNDIVETGDITWLKFEYNSKKLLISNKAILSTTWNKLNNNNLVLGKNINIDGVVYKCRLMTGGNADPATSIGGEWDELIIKHQSSLENFTMQEMTLCKESHTENPSTYCVARGQNVNISSFASMLKDNFRGWRPVLEYVGIEVPTLLNEESTLINAVNKTNEIEATLKAQRNVLSDNLISKGVNVISSDKMSTLIDKVGKIKLGKKWAKGDITDRILLEPYSSSFQSTPINFDLDFTPSRIVFSFQQATIYSSYSSKNISIDSDFAYGSNSYCEMYSNERQVLYLYIGDITSNGFNLYWKKNNNSGTYSINPKITWYAYE